MSIVKRAMEADEQKNQAAVKLLIETGYFERCEFHDENVYTVGGEDELTSAYKLGNSRWDHYFDGIFKTRNEMTDTIKSVAEDPDYAEEECQTCRSMLAED